MVADKCSSTAETRKNLRRARNNVQRESRRCPNEYLQSLCISINSAFESGNLKEYYSLLKVAMGPTASKSVALKGSDGQLITDRSKQLDRWIEHYSELHS